MIETEVLDSGLDAADSGLGDADDDDFDEAVEVQDESLPDHRYIDRELSWIAFNQRVLELAEDPATPLLERANFLANFASNLDEFFMVRVAGLKRRIVTGLAVPTNIGRAPHDVLTDISASAHALQVRHAEAWQNSCACPADAGIEVVTWESLSDQERADLYDYFQAQVFPVLMPLAVDPAHPFPYISGLSLNLAIRIRNAKTGRQEFARLKVPSMLPRFVLLPGSRESVRYLPLEELISNNLDDLFPGMEILEHHTFRLTRNEDVVIEEDETENLIQALETELLRRRFGPPIRLEVTEKMDDVMLTCSSASSTSPSRRCTASPSRSTCAACSPSRASTAPSCTTRRTSPPRRRPSSPPTRAAARHLRRDPQGRRAGAPPVRVVHDERRGLPRTGRAPARARDQADPVPHLGRQPDRRGAHQRRRAGQAGARPRRGQGALRRGREHRGARKLEKAGVHVVYGLGAQDPLQAPPRHPRGRRMLRSYSHIGTGNYNPKTSRLYEDFGLFTTDPQVGRDLTRLFNELSGYAIEKKFKRLLVAPLHLRKGLLRHIDKERRNALAGKPARVGIKVNSIVDEEIIDALYRASQAGVRVDVWVRGICSLKAGIPGVSDNITVRSILGRYLEHSRIFAFHNDGDPQVYIGSADMMHRNLDRRVEALVRVTAPAHLKEILDWFDTAMSDQTSSWHLGADEQWVRHSVDADGKPLTDLQELTMSQIQRRRRARAVR